MNIQSDTHQIRSATRSLQMPLEHFSRRKKKQQQMRYVTLYDVLFFSLLAPTFVNGLYYVFNFYFCVNFVTTSLPHSRCHTRNKNKQNCLKNVECVIRIHMFLLLVCYYCVHYVIASLFHPHFLRAHCETQASATKRFATPNQ